VLRRSAGGNVRATEDTAAHGATLLWVADDQEPQPMQKTRPKKGEPIEIPVPKKRDVMELLEKAAKTSGPDRGDRDA
jgi:hypothetical protein